MMKNTTRASMDKKKNRQSGNIFFMLFASIAVIGAMTAGAGNIVKGLVTSMSDVTRKTITEEKMQGGARISIQASTGCDTDTPVDLMEPLPFRDPAAKPHPTGGGLLPEDIGATTKDPWGTEYGYCAWNPGNGTCANPNFLAGSSTTSDTVVAVISAGKDRKFSTTCNPATGVPADCTGKGEAHYNDPVSGHCYFRSTFAAATSWGAAQSACAAEGGYLAVPNDAAEVTLILNNLTGGAQNWIGIDDQGSEGVWQYSFGEAAGSQFWNGDSTGAPVGGLYNNWDTGNPANSFADHDCGVFGAAGKWSDTGCNTTWLRYVCEVPQTVSGAVTKTAGGDDIVLEYTYDDANGMSGNDLWKINDTKPGSAKIDKNIDVAGGADLSGPLNLMKSGLILPGDGDTGPCDATTDQQIRMNFSNNPPTLEICIASSNTWETVSMGGGGASSPDAGPTDYIAQWKLDETSGGTIADTTSSHNGVWNDNTDDAIGSEAITGHVDGGLDFDDADYAYIEVEATVPTTLDNLGPMSVCAWLNIDDIPGANSPVIGKAGGAAYGDGGWGLYANKVGGNVFGFYTGKKDWVDTAAPVTYDTWQHVCATWDGTDGVGGVTIYNDGVAAANAASGLTAGTTDDSAYDVVICHDPSGSTICDAGMDDIRIYNRVLTALEVSDIYNGVVGGSTPPPSMPTGYTAYWKFDEGAGGTISDESGNNITGAITGATWVAGKNGTALQFDGLNNHVDLGSPLPILNIDEDITVGAWVNLDTWGYYDFSTLFTSADSNEDDWGISVEFYDPGFYIYAQGNNPSWAGDKNRVALGSWQYITVTVDSGIAKFYVDGIKYEESPWTLKSMPAAAEVWLGGHNMYGNQAIDGAIDDFVIYPRALSDDEVISLYESMGGVYNHDLALNDENFMIDSQSTQCISAGKGPFLKVGESDAVNSYLGLHKGNNYLYASSSGSGWSYFTPTGNGAVTRTGTQVTSGGNSTSSVYERSDYTFVANLSHNLAAFENNGDGTFTEMPGAFDTPGTPVSITGLGQYIIVADTDAVRAYSYNGTTFIMTGEYITTGNAVHVWTDGKYIYVSASGDGLLALTFDGSDFTLVAQMPADSDPDASTIMSTGDGNYIYVNDTDRLKVLSFNGKYFVHVFEREPYYSSSRLDALYVDGVNIFLGWSAPYKLEAIRISGDKLVNVATNNKADGVADIRSDGTYLYVTYAASPMEIYSGFTCNSGNNNPKGMPVSLNYQKGKIGTGVQRVCAIYPDGSLWCWGYGAEGGNGNGSTASQTTPVRVNSTRSFVQVDLGGNFACAIDTNADGWCWGQENYQQQLGNGSAITGNQSSPTRIAGNRKWSQISTGYSHSCGITTQGDLYCWGYNVYGQLGDGGSTTPDSPVLVSGNRKWVSVSAGTYKTCAIDTAGQLWCWGNAYDGDLGLGQAVWPANVPLRVLDPGPWKKVSIAGYQNCGIKVDGSLWCWGRNLSGGIGQGTANGDIIGLPVQIPDVGPWEDLEAGGSGTSHHATCGIKQDGTAWCWGSAILGNGDGFATGEKLIPQRVLDPGPWMEISTAGNNTCGIKADGVWCWGTDDAGEQGNGATTGSILFPSKVSNAPGANIWLYDDAAQSISATGSQNILMGTTNTIGYKASGPIHNCAGLGASYYNDPATGHCYFKSSGTANWDTAQAACAANGAYLATITSQTEQNKVATAFGMATEMWMGISDAGTEGTWLYTGGELAGNQFWSGTGNGNPQNGLYNTWLSGEPNAATTADDCGVLFYSGTSAWHDMTCTGAKIYLCEIGTSGSRGGLSFPTSQDRLLSHYDYSTELAIQATAANTSAQISWKAASAANTRSMGIDYGTKAFEIGNNVTGVTDWMHAITPHLFINTDGRVGVGVAAGTLYNKLTLGGGLRVGNDTSNCHVMRAGTLRYVGGGKPYQYCNGSAWVDF